MTKFNVRALTIAYLGIEKNDRFLDIGGGTGSISIEAALQGANVTVIEREEEGIALIKENSEKFGVEVKSILGSAPIDLPEEHFNKCFIGGSGGKLEDIFKYLDEYLEDEGILCGNFIMLKNVGEFIDYLKKYEYKDVEVQLIQASYLDHIGLMKAHNPIYIIKGVK